MIRHCRRGIQLIVILIDSPYFVKGKILVKIYIKFIVNFNIDFNLFVDILFN